MTSGGSKIHDRPHKSTCMSAQRRVTPELNICHVLVVLGAGICLAGPLVWACVKYWLFCVVRQRQTCKLLANAALRANPNS
jgi:hypothetical protein